MHWKGNTKFCIIRSVGVQVDMFSKKLFADKSLQIAIYPETKDVDIQCENALKENKEIQCKPTTNTKWIQVNFLFIFCI